MSNACIEQGLIIAALVAVMSGCAGPSVMVEDRTAPEMDRPKGIVSKVAGAPRATPGKKPAATQPLCGDHANLIHPLHFGTGTNTQCPLLFWEVRTVREELQTTQGSK